MGLFDKEITESFSFLFKTHLYLLNSSSTSSGSFVKMTLEKDCRFLILKASFQKLTG